MANAEIPAPLVVGDVATNCWVVPLAPGEAAVFDPGDEAERIIARLRETGCRPVLIILTHGHYDHCAALPDLLAAFPGAATAIHEEDARYLGRDALKAHRESFGAIPGGASLLAKLWKPMPDADTLLAEGDRIGPFTVLHTPGHTPGSASFYWPERRLLFSGDTLFAQGFGRTDLPGGDETKLAGSLKRLFALDGDIRVLSGHGENTEIGTERGYYRFSV